MCGIAGHLGFQEQNTIEVMLDRLAHRGPDDRGVFYDYPVTLGQNRLSIIGLENGHQPLFNEKKTIALVANGEIYNYQELRAQLQELGHRFSSDTDCEVILHAYEQWGEAGAIRRLEGMFAFALWDAEQKRLWLARDRMGIKPLYYWSEGDQFVFASELKAMIAHKAIPRALDKAGVLDIFVFRYARNPRTPLKNIYKVRPGEYLIWQDGRFSTKRYWRLHLQNTIHSESDAVELVQSSFDQAVKSHMISDVPIGFMLSGGIDSSAIVASASKFTNKAHSYSIGFENQKDSELPYAQIVAKHFQTEHESIEIKASDIRALPQVIWYNDEPVGGPSSLAFFQLLGSIKNVPKVILFGHGADEILAGYEQLKIFKICSKVFAMPGARALAVGLAWLAKTIFPADFAFARLYRFLRYFRNKARAYLELVSVSSHAEVTQFFQPSWQEKIAQHGLQAEAEVAEYFSENNSDLNAIMLFEIENWLADDINHRLDRMTMAHSVEARVPFLDHKFVEATAQIAIDLKLKAWKEKYILKQAFAGILPSAIVQRKKQRFNTPIDRFFGDRFPRIVESLLAEDNLPNKEVFQVDKLRQLLRFRSHFSYRLFLRHNKLSAQFFARPLWNYMIFQFWYKMYIEGETPESLAEKVERA